MLIMTERRAFLSMLAASGIPISGAGTQRSEPASTVDEVTRNVRAFGAKGDGVTDDTAAFNAATKAAAPASESAGIGVFVPPGTYRIDGTVFVRKGQELIGAGDATVIDASRAQGRTLVLGRDQRDRDDPGGAPVTVSELRFFGGSDKAPLIEVPLAGFAVRNLFITSAGIAISISGGDGIVSNVIIDQALNGIVLRGARNVLIDNVISYAANYAITVGGSTNDVAFSNMVIAYSKNASILFAEGATGITSVRFSGITFVSNIEYPSFVGHIHVRAESFDAQFSDCVFRNWRGYAVTQEAGSGADLSFANCTFDGARSHPSYNVSATASAIRTGVDGKFWLSNCRFSHLPGAVVTIGPSLRALTIDGGRIEECRGDPIRFVSRAGGRIRIRGVDGFGRRVDQGGTNSIILPWWGVTSGWRVTASRREAPGGMTIITVMAFEKAGIVACSIKEEQRQGEPFALTYGFGSTGSSVKLTALRYGSGTLCVTAPAAAIDWTVETAV